MYLGPRTTANWAPADDTRYDTRSYFNVCSKADKTQLNLPHGTKLEKWKRQKKLKSKERICLEISANSPENPQSQSWCVDVRETVLSADTRRRSLPRVLPQLLQGDDVPRTTAQKRRLLRIRKGRNDCYIRCKICSTAYWRRRAGVKEPTPRPLVSFPTRESAYM